MEALTTKMLKFFLILETVLSLLTTPQPIGIHKRYLKAVIIENWQLLLANKLRLEIKLQRTIFRFGLKKVVGIHLNCFCGLIKEENFIRSWAGFLEKHDLSQMSIISINYIKGWETITRFQAHEINL